MMILYNPSSNRQIPTQTTLYGKPLIVSMLGMSAKSRRHHWIYVGAIHEGSHTLVLRKSYMVREIIRMACGEGSVFGLEIYLRLCAGVLVRLKQKTGFAAHFTLLTTTNKSVIR